MLYKIDYYELATKLMPITMIVLAVVGVLTFILLLKMLYGGG